VTGWNDVLFSAVSWIFSIEARFAECLISMCASVNFVSRMTCMYYSN
jgi:hypothetical protein